MTAWDGSSPSMPTLRLDRDTADRLLAGRVAPDDAPPGYADLARLVAAVGAAPAPRELVRSDDDVAAAIALRSRGPVPGPFPRPPGRARSRFARARTFALVAGGTIVATSGLAAAGVLPDPVQDLVSDVLSRVGITIPDAVDERQEPAGPADGDAPADPSPAAGAPGDSSGGAPGSGGQREPTARSDDADGPPADPGPPDDTPGNGPPDDTPGNGPPDDTPGNGPPTDHPGNGPPENHPGNGPPDDPGPPEDTPGNGPPADPGGGQGGPPPGHGN